MEPSKLSHELLQIVLGELHASALDPLDAVEELPHQPRVAMLIRLKSSWRGGGSSTSRVPRKSDGSSVPGFARVIPPDEYVAALKLALAVGWRLSQLARRGS